MLIVKSRDIVPVTQHLSINQSIDAGHFNDVLRQIYI